MNVWGKILPLAAALAFMVGVDAAPVTAQQTGSITGTVVDASNGRTLESAQVFIEDLNLGALSNRQGRFVMLNVPAGTHELQVEIIGYTPSTQQVTVTAGQTATVEFQLESTALRLQELVVTGVAGSTPRIKLPFTVEKIDFAEMPVPSPSVEGLISGKVPGAKVTRGSGQPGQAGDIMLRGPTTIFGGQSPLIIIDGVITDNTLADIASLDVASIEIVKGAAAASMYGSRAQNGVVQIQTQRGENLRLDQTRVTVRSEFGGSALEGEVPLSSNHFFLTNANGDIIGEDGSVIDLRSPDASDPPIDDRGCVSSSDRSCGTAVAFQDKTYPYPLFDQIEEFFDPGEFLQNYVAVEGRTGTTNYRASFTQQDREGVVPEFNEGFQLNSFRLNLDHEVNDNLNVSLSTFFSQSDQDDDVNATGALFDLTFIAPYLDLRRRDTTTIGATHCPDEGCFVFNPDPLGNETNPLYPISLIQDRDDRQRFLGAANVVWSPATWFELEGNYSIDRADFFETRMTPRGFQSDQSGISPGFLRKTQVVNNDINASITASFNKAFGDLTTRTRVRYLLEDQHRESFRAQGENFAAANTPTLDNVGEELDVTSNIQDILAEGFFFISALDYQGKYVGDFLVRRDGSSLFGEEERWQTYFRASGAWRMAQEAWWPVDDINEFKLRYSIGTAGGRPNFSARFETFSVNNGNIGSPQTIGNPRLKPEFSTEQELALEAVLFNKVSTGVTYAWNEIEDQLLNVDLPALAGFQRQWQNAGTLESETFEAFIETSLIDTPEFTWSSRLNFDRTTQEITQLDIPDRTLGRFFLTEGAELGTFFGDQWARSCSDLTARGIDDCSQFQQNDEGYLVFVGAGNSFRDGVAKGLWGTSGEVGAESFRWGRPIKVVQADGGTQNLLGNTTPDANVSFGNTVRWKNLSLYALLDGEFGTDIYNQTRQWAYREDRSGNQDQSGKPAGLKKPIDYYQDLYNTNQTSGEFVEDGTFVKLREVSLRYSFDAARVDRWFGAAGVDGLTLNVVGRNLLTITDYQGYDPEVGQGGSARGGSEVIGRQDNFGYPNFREFTASIQVVF